MVKQFAPTEARGSALADEVLAEIEAERAYNNRYVEGPTHRIEKKNAWMQGNWGEVFLDALPAGTQIELVPPDVKTSRQASGLDLKSLAVIDSGVTCGTAGCFAGHAATLAGDRMLVGLSPQAAEALRQKGLKANVKRFMNKFFKEMPSSAVVSPYWSSSTTRSSADYVLTREGKIEHISERAKKLLGLTAKEVDVLFAGSNSINDLRLYVEQMRQGYNLVTGRKKRR